MPDAPEAGEVPSPFTETGNADLYKYSGFDRDEFLNELKGWRAAQVYREMSDNSAIVGAVLTSIEQTLLRVAWKVEEGEGPDAAKATDLVESAMADMSHPWKDVVSSALTMLPYGFAWMETVYKRRVGPDEKAASSRSRHKDGMIGWRKFTLIPADTVWDWNIDTYGGVESIEQNAGGHIITIPIEKSLLFRTTRRRPAGRSILRNSYRSYYLLKRVEEIEGIGIERDLAGLPVFYLDPLILNDPSRKSEYQNIVRNIRRDEQEGVLLPAVFDENRNQLVRLELLTAAGQRQFNVGETIARHTRHIAMTAMQDVLLLGHERVGTQGLAQEKRDLSEVALAAWLDEIAEVINTYAVNRLLRLNGLSTENPPTIVPGALRETDVLSFTQGLRNISRSGFTLAGDPAVEDFVRRRLGLPLLPEGGLEELAPPNAGFPPMSVPAVPPSGNSGTNGSEATVGAGAGDMDGQGEQ